MEGFVLYFGFVELMLCKKKIPRSSSSLSSVGSFRGALWPLEVLVTATTDVVTTTSIRVVTTSVVVVIVVGWSH